jgi:hypothetical protein
VSTLDIISEADKMHLRFCLTQSVRLSDHSKSWKSFNRRTFKRWFNTLKRFRWKIISTGVRFFRTSNNRSLLWGRSYWSCFSKTQQQRTLLPHFLMGFEPWPSHHSARPDQKDDFIPTYIMLVTQPNSEKNEQQVNVVYWLWKYLLLGTYLGNK